MDLALNNLQRLICHNIQTTNQPSVNMLTDDSLVKFLMGIVIHNSLNIPPYTQQDLLWMKSTSRLQVFSIGPPNIV